VRVQLLGRLELWRNGEEIALGSGRQRAVFALLIMAGGQPVARGELVRALWDESIPASATNIIQTYVKRLRHILEPGRRAWASNTILRTAGDGYELDVSAFDIDLFTFRKLVETARQADRPRAAELLDSALGLWRGSPLVDVPVLADHPAVTGLLGERRAAALGYAEAAIATGTAAGALGVLEELVRTDPLDETAAAALVRACHAAGERGRAFAVYNESRRRLADELGVDPGPGLAEAHLALLDGAAPAARTHTIPKPAQLPADLLTFTGRAAELARLEGIRSTGWSHPTAVTIVTIDGPAGVGKTALAVHWAHRVAGRFPDGQLYVNLRGFGPTGQAPDTAEVVRGFLDAFGLSPHRIPPALSSQLALYRTMLAGRRMVVVLDNARDADQVRPLLPGAPGCLVIITSRDRVSGLVAVEGAQPLTLGLLPPAEARLLLAERVGHDRVAAEPDAAGEIVRRCAGLPLALAVVAARVLAQPRFPLSAIAGELRRARLDALADPDPMADVRATLSWSYRDLDEPAARLFRLLGLPASADIGQLAAAALAGTAEARAGRALADLARRHLIMEEVPGRYRMHDLLRAYAAEVARKHDPEPDRRAGLRRLLDHYVHTAHAAALMIDPRRDSIVIPLEPPAAEPEPIADQARAWTWFSAERQAVLAAMAQAASDDFPAHAWQLAWSLFHFLLRQGYWHDLRSSQELALAVATRIGNRAAQGFSHRRLFPPLIQLGQDGEAARHLRAALDIYTELGDQVNRAHTYTDLNRRCGLLGRYEEALGYARIAVELFDAAGHTTGQAVAANLAGWDLAMLGHHEEALDYGGRALALAERGDDRHTLAGTWDTIGYVHQQRGAHEEAISCYERALSLFREVGDRFAESVTLTHLGETHESGGSPDAARDALRQALAILDELNHPDAEHVRATLANSTH
jgi:DNA-binding SARP family transcriptional activator